VRQLVDHQQQQRPEVPVLSKIRSKDLMPNTGNKFNDLYEFSKNMSQFKKEVHMKTSEE
jgi:hypothetical protein